MLGYNWTRRNKLRWNFNENTNLFIHENASENIVCEMAVILSRGICSEIYNYVTMISAINFSNKKRKFAVSTFDESWRSWTSSYTCIHFAEHFTRFQWKQFRWLAGTLHFWLSHFSGYRNSIYHFVFLEYSDLNSRKVDTSYVRYYE